VEQLEGKLAEKYDYLVTGHKLEVFGYCPTCKVII
jgi:Fe2+ or Zn2+ uptake regulation protein